MASDISVVVVRAASARGAPENPRGCLRRLRTTAVTWWVSLSTKTSPLYPATIDNLRSFTAIEKLELACSTRKVNTMVRRPRRVAQRAHSKCACARRPNRSCSMVPKSPLEVLPLRFSYDVCVGRLFTRMVFFSSF